MYIAGPWETADFLSIDWSSPIISPLVVPLFKYNIRTALSWISSFPNTSHSQLLSKKRAHLTGHEQHTPTKTTFPSIIQTIYYCYFISAMCASWGWTRKKNVPKTTASVTRGSYFAPHSCHTSFIPDIPESSRMDVSTLNDSLGWRRERKDLTEREKYRGWNRRERLFGGAAIFLGHRRVDSKKR